mgnify:CR=1 FL=1
MYLNKLLIKNFGKFNNKEIVLTPGINVIKGEKGSGKTTIKDFIVSMLYGFTNCALNEKNNKFELYKPKDGGVYSGKAYIKDEEQTFFVERSFAKKNSRTSVLELKSGRDIKIENENLDGKIFDCCRDDYVNGMCIDDREGNYEGYLKSELDNMIVSGASSINLDRSIAYLKKKRKEYDTSAIIENIDIIDSELEDYEDVDKRLKTVRKKIRDVEEELAIETARRKREARRLIQTKTSNDEEDDAEKEVEKDVVKSEASDEETAKEESVSESKNENSDDLGVSTDEKDDSEDENKNIFLDADLLKDYKPERKLTDRIWFIILTGLFVIGVIAAVVYILPFDNAVRQIFVICTILFVIVTIVEGLYAKGIFDEEIKTPSEEEFKRIIYELERKTETYEEVDIDMSFAQTYIDRREKYTDEERDILKDMARRDELREERKAQEIKLEASKKEIHAINLALNTINDLSKDISKNFGFMINNNISGIISKLSDNNFNDLYINDDNKLMVMGKNGYIDIGSLDDVGMKQVYLSIRFAIAKSMSEYSMPVLFDGILDDLNNSALDNALEIIKGFDSNQIIILSKEDRVIQKLKDNEEEYNLVYI